MLGIGLVNPRVLMRNPNFQKPIKYLPMVSLKELTKLSCSFTCDMDLGCMVSADCPVTTTARMHCLESRPNLTAYIHGQRDGWLHACVALGRAISPSCHRCRRQRSYSHSSSNHCSKHIYTVH